MASLLTEFFHEIVAGLLLAFMAWHLRTPFILSNLHHAINKLNDWLLRESKRLDAFEAQQEHINEAVHNHDKRITILEIKESNEGRGSTEGRNRPHS